MVGEVDEAVSIAVDRTTDRCLIEQTCAADPLVVDLLKDVLTCRPFDDGQDVPGAAAACRCVKEVLMPAG